MVAHLKQHRAMLLRRKHVNERAVVSVLTLSGTGIGNGYPHLIIFG